MCYVRSRTISLVPSGRCLVRIACTLQVAHLILKQIAQVLLVRCGAPEVALGAVLVDGEFETSHGVLGSLGAIYLKGIDVCVGRIVGLFQVSDLDLGGLFKSLSCFAVCVQGKESVLALDRSMEVEKKKKRSANGTDLIVAFGRHWRLRCRGRMPPGTYPLARQRI